MEFLEGFFSYDPSSPLIFTGLRFWIFFGVHLFIFSLIYQKIGIRNTFLFVTSLFFYYKTGGSFVILLFLTVLVNYFFGIWSGKKEDKTQRKKILLLSLLFNLGMLVWFKYTGFFIGLMNDVFGTHLHVFNFISWGINGMTGSSLSLTDILVPVGISFYTFQAISYSIEVYRKRIEPIRNFREFGFYITFFPNLISGPIVKPQHFLPQVRAAYSLSKEEFGLAGFLILSGLVKKIVFADYISANFVGRVFENPNLFTGFESLLALYGYALQIYFDFSGYTDLAIGIALLLGFRLPPNFDAPYKARNISDFWRRWHMSLTTWFRDYLFLPFAYYLSDKMGKPKYFGIKTEMLIYMAGIFITFLLCGLWHGAALNFILWGALQGVALAIHKIFYPKSRPTSKTSRLSLFASRFFTFHFIVFSWIIFRISSYESFSILFRKLIFQFHPELIFQVISAYRNVFMLILTGFLLIWAPSKIKEGLQRSFVTAPEYIKFLIIACIVIIIYQFRIAGIQSFIYFQF
ncbi:MAG: MBOAT family protein [Bacteroidetes bacterium]|nr:MBOAT family protein [Bacteroidota bacterium]